MEFNFTIKHLPGVLNTAADALSQISISTDPEFLIARSCHKQYGHPGIHRLNKWLHSMGNAHSIQNLADMCQKVVSNCCVCAEVKPRWIMPLQQHVIQSMGPWQRIAIDFMTNKPTSRKSYSNILTIIDEYSHFLFAFPTCDQSSSIVIKCLSLLFNLFGPPTSVHSDWGEDRIFFSRYLILSHKLGCPPESHYTIFSCG